MTRVPQIEVIMDEGSHGELRVCSPAVGMYSGAPEVGDFLGTRSCAGRLTCLGRTVHLVVPHGYSGQVVERVPRNRRDPVEYGQVILRLIPANATQVDFKIAGDAPAFVDGLPEGCFAVASPTHGMFYRRPRPDAPAYVEAGQIVDVGNTLALVEVMKCFSAITYGGEGQGLPPRGRIVDIRAEDASEVRADQILFVIEPA